MPNFLTYINKIISKTKGSSDNSSAPSSNEIIRRRPTMPKELAIQTDNSKLNQKKSHTTTHNAQSQNTPRRKMTPWRENADIRADKDPFHTPIFYSEHYRTEQARKAKPNNSTTPDETLPSAIKGMFLEAEKRLNTEKKEHQPWSNTEYSLFMNDASLINLESYFEKLKEKSPVKIYSHLLENPNYKKYTAELEKRGIQISATTPGRKVIFNKINL